MKNSSSGNNEQKDIFNKYNYLIKETGNIWKIFKDFVSLFQKRFIDHLSDLQTACFEKDAICLDALRKVQD